MASGFAKVTGKRLNVYAQEKLWSKIGTESDASFYESKKQPDICAFACFNATLRDYGRIGLVTLQGGVLGEHRVVSSAWVYDSTKPEAPYLKPKRGGPEWGYGYAYQWWVPPGDDDVFMALGIDGQCIYVNPARHVVIVQTSAWPEPVSPLLEGGCVRQDCERNRAVGSKHHESALLNGVDSERQ